MDCRFVATSRVPTVAAEARVEMLEGDIVRRRGLQSGGSRISRWRVLYLLYHSDQLGLPLSSGGPPAEFLARCHCHQGSAARFDLMSSIFRAHPGQVGWGAGPESRGARYGSTLTNITQETGVHGMRISE